MTPEELTIKDLKAEIGDPPDTWHGRCTEVARAAKNLLGEQATEIYGHYRGPVHEDSYWARRGIIQHGWILLDDGRVMDTTRWSFEHVEPYVYIGPNDEDYDEGGNVVRSAMRGRCPQERGQQVDLDVTDGERMVIEGHTGMQLADITILQLHWLANMPYDEMGWTVCAVYDVLLRHDLSGLIPWDNLQRARREGRIPRIQIDEEVEG